MADTSVETTVYASSQAYGMWGPYWIDTDTAVVVWIDSGFDIRFSRTTDKGANWTDTLIRTGSAYSMSAWFDQETPGDSGNLVHVVWQDATDENVYYRTVDVSDASLGTLRTVGTGLTIVSNVSLLRTAITKTVSGNVIIAVSTQSEVECWRSTDGFNTSNDNVGDVYESGTEEDWCLLYPAITGDDDDACALFWDRSANDITIKMYDESDSGSWTEYASALGTSEFEDPSNWGMDAAVRHSDGHILIAWHSNIDQVGDDFKTVDITPDSIASPSFTAKTNIFTDQGESGGAAVFINQQNDYVYVAYMKGGTWLAEVDVVYHFSTDGMANWQTESAYSEVAADDVQDVAAGRTVGEGGGRYMPYFFNQDLSNTYINENNDVEIAAVSGDLSISESDGLTVGDTATLDPITSTEVSESDGLTVGEATTLFLTLDLPTSTDGLTVGDTATVDPVTDGQLSVADGLTVGETVTVAHELDLATDVSDGLTVGDTATVDIPIELDRDVSESDGITLGETVTVGPVSLTEISETEALTVGEAVTVTHELDLAISVSDDLTIGDNADPELISFISEADGVTLGETVTVDPVFPHDISESDGLTVGEVVDLERITFISVSDGLAVGETVSIDPVFPHNISETDDVTVGDSAIVLIPVEGELDVIESDNIVLGEAVTVDVSDPQIVEADGLTIGEVVDLELILFISESDGITVGELVDLEWISFVSELDALTVGEAVTVTHELDLEIDVSDSLTVGEAVTLAVTEHNISIVDGLTLGETVSVDPLLLDIILSENITLGEAVTLTGIESAELTVSVAESVLVGEVVRISGILGVAGPPWKTKRRERGIEFPEKALLKGIRSQQEQHAEKLRMQAEQDALQNRRQAAEARVVDRQNDQREYEAKREKARQSSLVNLELAAMAREEEQSRKDEINKKRAKSLKKARATKKRRAKAKTK